MSNNHISDAGDTGTNLDPQSKQQEQGREKSGLRVYPTSLPGDYSQAHTTGAGLPVLE